jgi:hypothetical protein
MTLKRSALLVYNTVDRLRRGDLYHTVTTADVLEDLSAYPPDFPITGIGTTSWLRRSGEIIAEGMAGRSQFLWTDPETTPVGQVIDLCWQRPTAAGTVLTTPRIDDNDQEANFPFLAVAVCDPAHVITLTAEALPNLDEWLTVELHRRNVGVAGVAVDGDFGVVETTDAFNIPLTGLDLSRGYTGDQFFRSARYEADRWQLSGVYAANPTLQPFISIAGHPLHLHGYRVTAREGGHIVHAAVTRAAVRVYPLDDLILRIHDVAQAYMPTKSGAPQS